MVYNRSQLSDNLHADTSSVYHHVRFVKATMKIGVTSTSILQLRLRIQHILPTLPTTTPPHIRPRHRQQRHILLQAHIHHRRQRPGVTHQQAIRQHTPQPQEVRLIPLLGAHPIPRSQGARLIPFLLEARHTLHRRATNQRRHTSRTPVTRTSLHMGDTRYDAQFAANG